MRILTLALTLLLASSTFAQDYDQLHDLLIKFYGYQRAGLANGSANNLNSGFENAAHGGDSYNGNPVDGGWYDAGDYIKFGMNLGYSVYCLLKGYDVFPNAYADNYGADHSNGGDGIPDILNQVKFATDYLIKAVIDENTIVFDVGIASEEHRTWGVVNPDGRNSSKITICDGGDIPATYAACLALMSVVYREFDSTYADQCLEKAKVAFNSAKSFFDQGANYCSPQIKDNAALYDYSENRQINDRKAAAGVELYRATNGEDPIYAAWAKTAIPDVFNCMGYSFIGPLAGFEVWRQGLGSPSALIDNLDFIEGKVRSSGLFNGIYQNSGWGTARDAGTAAFEYALAYVTTGSANTREQYIQRVEDHIAWVSGNNPRNQSFIVGYEGGPSDIHYRSPGTPNGALVSGPNGDGDWADDGSPKFCEVAIDYNAGIIGAVAFMKALSASDAVRVTEAFSASPTADADLNDEGVTFSATFSSSVEWSIDINGSFGSKTLSGSGSSINKVWDGTADEGFFLSDELVSARLSIDGEIAIIDLVNISPISITIGSAKKPGANPDDVLFDDFEDGDEINEFDGVWEPIGTITSGLYRTMISTRAEDGSEVIQARGSCSESGPDAYMGVRATFNSEGTPVDLGNPTSILFDLKANTSTNIAVELEQPNVTDGAYHRVIIPVTEGMNTYRLDISDFAQPDWKTLDIDLDLNNMSALRFTVYDSIGAAYLYLDNVYIENISLGIASPFTNNAITSFKPVFTNSNLVYTMPQLASETLNLSVYNLAGKQVLNKVLTAQRGKRTTVSLSQLPHGVYTVVHSSEGKMIGDKMMITHVK